jgi:hypothetical protein
VFDLLNFRVVYIRKFFCAALRQNRGGVFGGEHFLAALRTNNLPGRIGIVNDDFAPRFD